MIFNNHYYNFMVLHLQQKSQQTQVYLVSEPSFNKRVRKFGSLERVHRMLLLQLSSTTGLLNERLSVFNLVAKNSTNLNTDSTLKLKTTTNLYCQSSKSHLIKHQYIHLPRLCILDRSLIQSMRQSGLFSDWCSNWLGLLLFGCPKVPHSDKTLVLTVSLRPRELLPMII